MKLRTKVGSLVRPCWNSRATGAYAAKTAVRVVSVSRPESISVRGLDGYPFSIKSWILVQP